jgi:HlyD family secretion protein
MQTTVDAEGKTRVHDRFVVAAPVSGRLTRISFRRGDSVRQDEAIARIEPLPISPLDPRQTAEARARVVTALQLKNEADAMVERIRAQCEQARREYRRAEVLVETGDIAKQEFERIRNAEQTCNHELEAAGFKARAAASEVDLARTALLAVEQAGQSGQAAVLVRSPVNGKVLRVMEESERVVSAGTPLIELSNRWLEVVIDVLSTDAVKVSPGMRVMIEGWGGEHPLEARVRLIEPSAFTEVSALGIEEQRVNVIADFTQPPSRIGDGYRVDARIIIWESDSVLKIPSSALFRHGDGWSVFVVEDGRSRRRAVETGHRSAFEVEIVNGISEGEEVILHPANEIDDGSPVSAR